MRGLAAAHGEAGRQAHTFPLSVDGIEIVASLVLLADRRAGRSSGWLLWAALVARTSASLAANVAAANADVIGRVVAGWPAFALLVAVKLCSRLLEPRPGGDARPATLAGDGVTRAVARPAARIGDTPRPPMTLAGVTGRGRRRRKRGRCWWATAVRWRGCCRRRGTGASPAAPAVGPGRNGSVSGWRIRSPYRLSGLATSREKQQRGHVNQSVAG
jgi:hypothetical protein